MSKLSGNKGEWSEIYVFLRLLETGRLYAATAGLKKLDDVFYSIISIVRQENSRELEYRINRAKSAVEVTDLVSKKQIAEKPLRDFRTAASRLYAKIINAHSAAFSDDETETFLSELGIGTLKARSLDKADIRIKVHDINTGFDAIQGFSIKSRLGSPSTLINAGETTNFTYEITGPVDDSVMSTFNNCSTQFKSRFYYLKDYAHCDVKFIGMGSDMYESNLLLIDGDLPEICADMLAERYSTGVSTVVDVLKSVKARNPLNYNLRKGHPFYEYKFKKLLTESALGMLPSKVWDGKADATGGYIIVTESGEVLCYHLFNRNEFEEYLLQNTKFETASTDRHGFGTMYKENGKYYIKLNLQVRFIK